MNNNDPKSKTGSDFGLEFTNNYPHDVLHCEVGEQVGADGTRKYFFVANSNNSGRTFPIGYCVRCGGHDTVVAARSCMERWLLDRHLLFDPHCAVDWTDGPCAICGTPTPHGAAIIVAGYNLGWFFRLCLEHRTRDVVARLLQINYFTYVWWGPQEWEDGEIPLTDSSDELAPESVDLQSEKEA